MEDLLTCLPDHCDWCLTFSGKTKKGRPCCELRALAALPKEQRRDAYEKVRRSDGEAAVEALSQLVMAEYRRKTAFKAKKQPSVRQKI